MLSNGVDGLKPVENPPVAVGSDPHVVEYINTVIISNIISSKLIFKVFILSENQRFELNQLYMEVH